VFSLQRTLSPILRLLAIQSQIRGFNQLLNVISIGQLLSYRFGRVIDEVKANYTQISMVKKNNVAVACMCARTARKLLGANGISLDYSSIRHMANIESVYTHEGTDDIHTLMLGHDITGIPAFRRTRET